MSTKKFHISDVLSITTGYLLSLRNMEGVIDLVTFMTNEERQSDLHLMYAGGKCKPHLLEQFPQLDTPEIQFAVGELSKALADLQGKKEETDKFILGWISKLTSGGYGIKCDEVLEVKPIQ